MAWTQHQTAGAALGLGQSGPVLNEKQLTASIKQTNTCERLLQLFTSHKGHINSIHVAAILTKLANITKSQPDLIQEQGQLGPAQTSSSAQAREALVQQLQDLLKSQRCEGHCPRGLANIIWALGKMQNAPDAELVIMLLRRFFNQLSAAIPQDIANVLWGVAQVTRDHGLICPPGCIELVAAQDAAAEAATRPVDNTTSTLNPLGIALPAAACADVCGKAHDISMMAASVAAVASEAHSQQQKQPSGSSSTAADTCQPMQPLLTVEQVQILLQHLCSMLAQAAPQTISNITCAICVLQHCGKWCMCCCLPLVRQLVTAFISNINESLPSHIHKVVKCLAQLSLSCAAHAREQWISWQPPLLQAMLSHMVIQRRALKQFHIVPVLRDVTQLGCLFLPLEVTTEVAAASAAAAAKVAATASATAAAAAHQASAEMGSAADIDEGVLLALAAAAAAVDEVLGIKVFDETDDDSGLPSSGLPMAAAAATAAAAAAARRQRVAVPHSAAAGDNATAKTPPSLEHAAESKSRASSDDCSPASPDTQFVHGVVSGMLQRLGVQSAGASDAASAHVQPSASAAAEPAGVGTSGGNSTCTADQAAFTAPADSKISVLDKLLGQLESLGLLEQYNILRSFCGSQHAAMGGMIAGTALLGSSSSSCPGGFASGRAGQPRAIGYVSSGGMLNQPLHVRQQLPWHQQPHVQLPQQQSQQYWDASMQQQQQQTGVTRASEGGGYSTAMSDQQQRMGLALVPVRRQQQQQQHVVCSPAQPSPPSQFVQQYQQQNVASVAEPGMVGYADAADMRLAGQDAMISPFQCTVSASAGSLQASLGSGLPDLSSPHDSSNSARTYNTATVSSKTSNSTSSSLQMAGSSSLASVPSMQAGLGGGFGSGPVPTGDRLLSRLPLQMSAPSSMQGMSNTPSPGQHGDMAVAQGSNFSTSKSAHLQQQQQQQQQYAGARAGISSSAGVTGAASHTMFVEAMSALSSEQCSPSMHGMCVRSIQEVPSMIDPPGLLPTSAAQAQQQQQVVQHAVAHNADSGIVMITQDGQQMAYKRLQDGTLVPVQQQQQLQQLQCTPVVAVGTSTGGSRPLPQQQQSQQMLVQQQQQQLQLMQQQHMLMAQNAQNTCFNLAGGNVTAVMATVQQHQATHQHVLQQQQSAQQLHQQQQQQQQQEHGRALYYLPGSNPVDGTAGGGVAFGGAGMAAMGMAASSGYMIAPTSSGSGSQVQLFVGAGGGETPTVSQGLVAYTVLSQGQMMVPEQPQQLYQRQLTQQQQQQQQVVGGLACPTMNTGLFQGGSGVVMQADNNMAQQLLLQQQMQQQQQMFHVLPPNGF